MRAQHLTDPEQLLASLDTRLRQDKGNKYKAEKHLAAYDEDCTLTVDYLLSLPSCTGRIASTGMCLGGHLVRPPGRALAHFRFG